jgi:hypothetical protein
LKSLGKLMVAPQMAHLVREALAAAPMAFGAAVYALSAPCRLDPTPPLRPAERTGNRDPRGGLAAPLSLPLVATPFSISETDEVQS